MKSFFGFWDSNNKIDEIQLTQIKLWANSILLFNKKLIYFFIQNKI